MNNFFVSLSHLRNRHFILIDCLICLAMPFGALVFRCLDACTDFQIYLNQLYWITLVFLAIKLWVLFAFDFYKRYWKYASIDDLLDIVALMCIATVSQTLVFHAIHFFRHSDAHLVPRSLPIVEGILAFLCIGAVRFSVRASSQLEQKNNRSVSGDRVFIVGAGSAGISLLQSIQNDQRLAFNPIGFIDDHPRKQGIKLRGLPVLGNRSQLANLLKQHQIDTVLIAMPSAAGSVIREIVGICRRAGVLTQTLPSLDELFSRDVRLENLREVKIEDLLRRDPIQTDFQRISTFLKGRKILVTGAGGSIGSELCRQILRCEPNEVLLLGHGENSIFLIHQELTQILGTWQRSGQCATPPTLKTCIADVRSYERLHHAFNQFQPDVVFHAAAHKHVPLMEVNSAEAVTNNILGTRNVVEVALQFNVQHLVMISTDKAVNPTSIMGTTKRIAEMLVLRAARQAQRSYVVVRFGNVLGSRGSVIPTFLRQIAAGGPITITHPNICRFFMTIPEAVQLVLQASVLGNGGEVFTLDMGTPLKILHLAEDLIRLSGYEVGRDIEIKFTGLRPGEKLYEELFIAGEAYQSTNHEKILIAQNASHFVSPDLDSAIQALTQAAEQNDTSMITAIFKRLVPEYCPQGLDTSPERTMRLESLGALAKKTASAQFRPQSQAYASLAESAIAKPDDSPLPLQGLQVHYQPIVNLQSHAMVGLEALLRCEHPRKGILLAGECLDIAQQHHLTSSISHWMLSQVCAQAASWQRQYAHRRPTLQVSLNLSSQEFYQPDLCEVLQRALDIAQLSPQHLSLDIPGFVLLEEPELAADTLSKLKRMGLSINLDNCRARDVRSQQWSNWLDRLDVPLDFLKLDRSWVQHLDPDAHPNTRLSLKTLQKTAQRLAANLVAVGVDRPQQISYLESIQCEYAQGYWFSVPVNDRGADLLLKARDRQEVTV